MSGPRIAGLMMQVCAGLGQAHARGIVHRDVKPDNVVLVTRHDDDGVPREQVKLCDFGLALLRASDSRNERFAGTPVYMSPEQCRGEELDARTDVYACGIMLFELATGTVPFLSDKPMVVINRHLSAQPPTLASLRAAVDPRLEPIVQKALKKVREERQENARALRSELKALLAVAGPAFDLALEAQRVPEASPEPSPVALPPSPPPPPSIPPPRAPSIAPASRRSEPPSWLEDKQDSYALFLDDMASGEKRAKEVSGSLARDPKAWLTKLLEERDARVVDKMLGEVPAAARLLAQRADARTLRALSSTIHGIATDAKRHPTIRASAASVMKLFADPTVLAPIAERLLRRGEDVDAAQALVLDAGQAGAYALYGARVKLAAEPGVREPFVATMRALGEASWAVVRAALERIPATALTGEHPRAAELAEDLLWSVPALRDDAAGALVAKYVRTTQASLCRAATQALGRLWAERAAPLLLALLDVQDDGVRVAAIAGLRQIGAVDEQVVARLVPILTRKVAAGDELRLASVAAMEFVTPTARPVAVPILVKLVRDLGPEDATVLAASRALLSVMGNEARAVIIERSDRANEPLKGHLLVLLRDPKLPEVDAKTIRALG
jgi:serine/threonine-protein kinase